MVFAGIFPVITEDFEELRECMDKLQLNDASLTYELETSQALGFGFRCGFLGMLHMEIIQERLEREFNQTVITTVPNVSFIAHTTKEETIMVNNPSEMPDPTRTDRIEEPYIKAQIITKPEYIGNIITLCLGKRGILLNQNYLTPTRVELHFEMPLTEIVFDFYDKLKSQTRGYASFDYHPIGYRDADIAKMDILLNGEKVDALSALIHRSRAADFGRKLCEKLKELLPRQQFQIAIQAAIGSKVIARETISALRKDVTAKCYGGDISRKRKLLEKQKEGKKRMRQVGNVEIPQEAFPGRVEAGRIIVQVTSMGVWEYGSEALLHDFNPKLSYSHTPILSFLLPFFLIFLGLLFQQFLINASGIIQYFLFCRKLAFLQRGIEYLGHVQPLTILPDESFIIAIRNITFPCGSVHPFPKSGDHIQSSSERNRS